MQTKHIIFGAAGAAFAGLVAHTVLSSNDNGSPIPANLTGSANLMCQGSVSPVLMEDNHPVLIKEKAVEANIVSITLHFNNGKIAGWTYIPSPQEAQKPLSNLELAGDAICPHSPQSCIPQTTPDMPTKLFEYAYLLERADESGEPTEKFMEIKGYGILSPDFRNYAGLQESDGELTASSLGCQVMSIQNAYAVK